MVGKNNKEARHGTMLSLTEAAALLRCHHNTVRAWVRQGKLKAVPMGPEKVHMFHKEDVQALRAPLEHAGVILSDDKHAFPVVGIGASAGGLDAISRTLAHLPTDLGLAYVIVQHLESEREVVLADLLRKKTSMPVAVIENGMRLSPDKVYVAPGATHVAINNSTFTLSAPTDPTRPIDAFFKALAHEYQNNAIGIVLSGTGSDGTEGLRAIQAEDGLTLAQDASALERSMPRQAVEAEVVDVVVKAEDIGRELSDLVEQLYPGGTARIPSKYENELGRILSFLHAQRGIDFTQYKEATIHRRIIRRMVLSKCRKLSDYSALLHGLPSEVDTLCNDMLINVTSFFRDPLFFKALDQQVFPALLKDRTLNDPLRIWVAACAGGEEVVSIAIALLEHVGDRALKVPVQIFATDLNERAVEKARLGIYKKNALQSVAPELVKKYFQHVDGHFQVIKTIRDMCVFAKHDLLKDPPFSRVDLISCQNMLIYLDNEAQERVVKSFHYALKPMGYLALGRSENATVAGEIFDQPDRNFKVYTRKYVAGERLHMDVRYKPTPVNQPENGNTVNSTPRGTFTADLDRDTERLLLNRYVPANVLVNKSLEIVRFRGNMTPYLAPATGKASLNLLKMVREDLAFDLRMLLQRVKKERGTMRKGGIPMRVDNATHQVALEVVPMVEQREPHYLVVFTEEAPARTAAPAGQRSKSVRDERERRIIRLEQELAEAREQMRLAAEDAEASQQELRSANEEVVSSNEELQSINEELETSKEELQSINEEFATINEELQTRNEALLESEERYRKLIELMPVAVYTCDASGHVRLFNEAAVRMWGRKPVVGETLWCGASSMRTVEGKELPLDHCPMAVAIKEERALKDVEAVVVQPSGEQRAVLANPTPLYDHLGKISGAINVVVDITERQRAEADRQQLSGMLDRSLNEIYIFDVETLKFEYVNQGALSNLGYTLAQMREMTPVDIKPELDARQFDALVKPLRSGEKDKLLFYTVHRRADGSDYPVEVHLQTVQNGPRRLYMAMILDITERKLTEERLQVITRTGKLGIWDWDIVADTITWTDPVYEIHGVEKGSFVPTMEGYEALIHPEDRERVGAAIKAALEADAPYTIEFRTRNQQGEVNWVYTNAVVLREGQRPVRMLGGTMNITERKLAEEAQHKLAAIVESSEDAILSRDLDGFITSWNKSAERIFGYTEEEVIGKSTGLLYPTDRRNEEEQLLERVRNGERIEHFETVRMHKDGSAVDVALTLSPLKDQQGRIIGASKVMRDITAIKKAREAVRSSEERFHLLADNVAQLIWMADADGSNFWFNQRWTEFTGRTVDELRADTKSLHHPDHFERVTESLRVQAEQGLQWEEQFPLKSKEGVYHWFLAMAMPVKDADGKVVRWFGTLTDITKERADRELIQESEERFRMLADHMSQMAYMADAQGKITWVNRRWIDYTGLDVDQMNDGGWGSVVHPTHVDGMAESFSNAQAKGETWEYVFRLLSTTGEYRWFLSRSVPIKGENGVVQRWFGTNTDITEQKLAEEALEESAKHKDHFLATLAHELRNPLAPLKNGLQLMELAPDDPHIIETTRAMMVRQLDHMVRLVDDLMDLSRISSGKIELMVEQVELAPVVATALESCKPLIERREHDLTVHHNGTPLFVHGDKARLTQVVANLVNNAAKYTPRGGKITLAIEQQDGEVVVRVKDSGIGIDPSAMPQVFDMFAQISGEHQKEVNSGLGIGLNIVQRLVHMHQGRITGHSEGIGKGCEFTVRLPLSASTVAPPQDTTPPPPPNNTTRRVLVVDDNQDAAFSMSMILKKQGHIVETAHDGVDGVAKAKHFQPQVIFMDIGMPRMNGYDACKAIRSQAWGRDLYIIALSGWGQAEDRSRSEEAGFDEHIVKPIDGRTLERLMNEAPVDGALARTK